MRELVRCCRSLAGPLLLLVVALAVAACGASGGSSNPSTRPSATTTPGSPAPIPSALSETYSNATYGFAFQYPSGFTVEEDPDFLTGEGTVFDLALVPTAASAEAYGLPGGGAVRMAVWVYEMDDAWRGLDVSQIVTKSKGVFDDYFATLDNVKPTAVERVEIDGFFGAQVAYSYDKITRRDDFWTLFLFTSASDYRLEVSASSPVADADRMEPVFTEVINSFTTL